MNIGLGALLSWQFILFSLGIFFITWMFRTIVEYVFKKIVGKTFWEDVMLPIIPCVVGVVAAHFATSYSYPDGLNGVISREIFGLVAGGMSGLIYRITKAAVTQYVGAVVANNTITTTLTQPTNQPNTGLGMGNQGQ